MRARRPSGAWRVPAERAAAAAGHLTRGVERARVARALAALPPALGWHALDARARAMVVGALDAYRAWRRSGVLTREDVGRALRASWPAWASLGETERAVRVVAIAAALEIDALE